MKTYPDAWLLGFVVTSLCAVWLQPSWFPVLMSVLLIASLLMGGIWVTTLLLRSKVDNAVNYIKKLSTYLLSQINILYFIFGLICGICWAAFNVHTNAIDKVYATSQKELGYSLLAGEQPITFKLQIIGIAQDEAWRWRFDGRIVADGKAEGKAEGKGPKVRLYWYQPEGEVPRPNELWQITARIRPISGRLNQGGSNFQGRLLRQGIYFTGSVQGAELLEANSGGARWQIFQFLSETNLLYRDIMLALMIGERQWITQDRWRLLQETGLAHVMAISGLHLTLVFATAWWLSRVALGLAILVLRQGFQLRFTPAPQPIIDKAALLCALALALCYAALAGFAVSTLRAFSLVLIFSISRWFAWRLPPLRLLLRCVAVVLILDPLAWLDAGFWLSVGAVTAIFVWQWRGPANFSISKLRSNEYADSQFTKKSGKLYFYFSQLLALELILTLALAPFAVLFFQGFPWIAPITNIVILPFFSALILPLCLVVVSLLLLVPEASTSANWVGQVLIPQLLFIADLTLHIVFYALELSLNFPQHWWSSGDARFGGVFLLLLLVWFWPAAILQRIAVALFALPLLHAFAKPEEAQEFAVHVLDVGQGTAIVVQRKRQALVFDAGPGYRFGGDIGKSTLLPFLHFHQLTPEWLVISHDHQDHIGGEASLRAQWPSMKVKRSRFHTVAGESWGWEPMQFPQQYQQGDSWPCAWGQQWLWQGVRVKALAPLPGPSFGPNNDSCVLQLEYKGKRILLTGDIQRQTELRMVGRYGSRLQSDVLILPHHGSRTSSQTEFLSAVKPDIAVVSRGYRNHFRMPHPDVLARLNHAQVPLWDTGMSGQVSIIWAGEGLIVRTFREQIKPRWFSRLLPESDY
ncbi:DNA internalization-related competence protein ComEC/Rec2 [Aliidiomarina iranensis]|uniref:DNA internalization-related competence protein ComEC/Rec2 n=1 Tax=Aliidiomarina iranensis TaxID=1434071 RepID=A0A432W0N5_9GAMM|nr:DNA internalization-related competence protein ComEC/Rec2 [Aliidiomarina iranensis]RUO22577.1 DNA internalization-related competence protein ComEC/Rec2 [Aliidiomarina iranensis]